MTKTCKLCVREQFYILRKPHLASLNHRQEIGTHCPHIRMSLLRNVEKVKAPDWRLDQDLLLICISINLFLLMIGSCPWNRLVEIIKIDSDLRSYSYLYISICFIYFFYLSITIFCSIDSFSVLSIAFLFYKYGKYIWISIKGWEYYPWKSA